MAPALQTGYVLFDRAYHIYSKVSLIYSPQRQESGLLWTRCAWQEHPIFAVHFFLSALLLVLPATNDLDALSPLRPRVGDALTPDSLASGEMSSHTRFSITHFQVCHRDDGLVAASQSTTPFHCRVESDQSSPVSHFSFFLFFFFLSPSSPTIVSDVSVCDTLCIRRQSRTLSSNTPLPHSPP